MRKGLLVAGIVGGLGLVAGCGDDSRPPVLEEPGTAGKTNKPSGGTSAGGESDGGAGGEGGSMSEGGPNLELLSPKALDDPNLEGVLSGNTVATRCRVTKATASVNAASVKLALLDATGDVLEEKAGTPTSTANVYESTFSLTTVPAGVVGFRCQAEDTDQKASSTRIKTFLDKGPVITFVSPAKDSVQAVAQPLDIEFTVEAAPLTNTDDAAEVDEVTLSVAGTAIDLGKASDKPGHYRLQVDPLDGDLFNPRPDGPTPVRVEATNRRKPSAVKSIAEESVGFDGAAPTIQIKLDQAPPIVVGSKVQLVFTVTDDVAGVDPSSVTVSLNNTANPYDPTSDAWTYKEQTNTFTFSFDSRQVDGARVQITVNVGAKDKVGNAAPTVSQLLYVDNYPPALDLDPLNIRTRDSTADAKCSISFDPVGTEAVNDRDLSVGAGRFRAVVVDQTNTFPGIDPVGSGTDPSSVRVYVQYDRSQPLLIDNDDDAFCDDVADVDSASTLKLESLAKDGTPQYGNDEVSDLAEPTPASLGCTTTTANNPEKLCDMHTSDMWHVIWDSYNKAPVIYASNKTGPKCTGDGWDFGTKVKSNGWVCVVARGVDHVGNVGVSRPLSLCLNDPAKAKVEGGPPSCALASETPPSCTDGCTPAARLGGDLWVQ